MSEPTVRAAPHNAALELKVPGAVSLREGLPAESVQLLLADDAEDIQLAIGHGTDPDLRDTLGYFIELSVYHQRDPETGRIFHSTMLVHPTRRDMVRLRDFLEFLLRQPE